MADDTKTTYPVIPEKNWWQLRDNFKRSIPTAATPGYIATALNMTEKSARDNILRSLVLFKIVDKDGKPLERARRWRDDEEYAKVCEEIREEIYPKELLEALPPPSPNRQSVERWFASKTGLGQVSAKKMAITYELLCEANPNTAQQQNTANKSSNKPKVTKTLKPQPVSNVSKQDSKDEAPKENPLHVKSHTQKHTAIAPAIHINIQIHIAADSTANQIDHIFASMAKHLGKLASGSDEQGNS